mmetsp:Transcript_44654/g.117082  ORF Transcript_44654/g.117082 Transcript_44654/m.117082 type:complete len:111 (+) Transcript_44654:54-386(+)
MAPLRILALFLCALTASGFLVQSPVAPLTRPSRTAISTLRMMADEPPAEDAAPAAPAEAPVAATPPPTENPLDEPKGFDWTQYSLTIGIFTVFVIVKSLSALGIYNPSGN